MKKIVLYIIIFNFLNLCAQPTSQEKLEKRKLEIQKEIAEYQKMLQHEKSREKSVLNIIQDQRARIRMSEKLIATTTKQTNLLNNDIHSNNLEINKLNKELAALKDDYAKMIVKSYKSKNEQSRIMFILSSENFLQAYKRIQYMKQYAGFRKMQGDEIKAKQDKLNNVIQVLESNKRQKEKIIAQTENERLQIEKQKIEQEKLAKTIQKDKKKLTAEINKKQKETKDIDRQIKKIINDAILAANKKNNANNNTKSNSNVAAKFVLSAEGKIESNNFKANKGKLPWPVEKGYVSLGHGDQPHPIHKQLTVHNSGVEISTEQGANARAVFDGEVLQVQVVSANNKAVYIQHGDFITVYLNLSSVSVSKGQKVSTKQNIGKIHTNTSGKTVIKFLVLQNTTTLNPETWLYNM